MGNTNNVTKVPSGYMVGHKKAILIWSTKMNQLAASQADAVIAYAVAPCAGRLVQVDMSIKIAGSTGDLADLQLMAEGSEIATAIDPAADTGNPGYLSQTIVPTNPNAPYRAGNRFEVTVDTGSNTTVEAVSACFIYEPLAE